MAYDDDASLDSPETGDREDELKCMFERWDRDIVDTQSQWAVEARLAFDMVAGEQWEEDAKQQLKEEYVAPITWNRIQPLVDAVSGAQIQNRHETKYYPREIGDVGVSEILTSAAEWVADEADFEDEETDAFYDALVCGLGWTELRIDYEEEPDGKIYKDRVDPLEMRWDPSARKRNLADRRYQRRRRPYTKEQFKERFPEWADEIDASADYEQPNFSSENPGDDYPENDNKEKRKDEIFVAEYQWYEVDTYHRVVDTMTGEQAELSHEDFENAQEQFKALGMGFRLDAVSLKRRTYYRAFCADDKILDYEKLDCEGFTYHPITGKRDRNRGTWYGLVRAMIDPQRWANKWMTQILVIINKNAKGGILAELDAFEDPKEALEEWATPDGIVWLKSGAISQGKIQNKPQPQYPQGLDRLIQMAISSIRDVTGINQEMLGLVDRNQPGILESQRKEAGYAMLSMFFDSLRRYRKMSGRMLLRFIQKYLPPDTMIRILGQEGAVKYVPLGYQDDTARYDVIVDEAPSGPNQKDKVWTMIVQMLPLLTRQPLPPEIWAEALRYSPLPLPLAEKLGAALMKPQQQPDPQQQQAQAEQAAMQKAAMQASLAKLGAEAALKTAQAQKTQSEVGAAQAGAQAKFVDVGKAQADIALTEAKTRLTDAQTQNQAIETMIAQLRALINPPDEPRVITAT